MKIIKDGKVVDTSKQDTIKPKKVEKTIEPAKFFPGDIVKTWLKTDGLHDIPEGVTLMVSQIVGEDIYSVLGPDGLVLKLGGAYLEKVKED